MNYKMLYSVRQWYYHFPFTPVKKGGERKKVQKMILYDSSIHFYEKRNSRMEQD